MSDLKVKEMNGDNYACCPNCGRMYLLAGRDAEVPTKCKRCGAPMDYEKAREFGERLARGEHSPQLTSIGERMRGMAQPEADKMVRGAANK